jgi:hypothetical protein
MKQKFVITNKLIAERACDLIRALPEEGPHEVIIRPHKSKRSLSQNALYWVRLDVIRLHIADSTGQIYSAEDIHEFFKGRFLPTKVVTVGGQALKIRQTTTKMDTAEFAEYMDNIEMFCADRLHLFLPVPGEREL